MPLVKYVTIFIFLISVAIAGCKKLVTVSSPGTSLTSENMYTDNATAASVLTGVYTEMSTPSPMTGATITSISLVAGLSADEFALYGGAANANSLLVQYYLNQLIPGLATTVGATLWDDFYAKLYIVNIALEGLSASNTLTPAVRQQLTGEAEFMRAFLYFYLVNLYGNVPLTTTSTYTGNATLSRTTQAQVYQQIITDLKNAKGLLTDAYVASDAISSTTQRVRPNKWAAAALLARAYLYTGDWQDAESEADSVIGNSALYGLDSLNNVFLENSTEAIWQLQPVNTGWNTEDARVFILPTTGPTANASVASYPVYIAPQLLAGFEQGDHRRLDWVDSVIVNGVPFYFPYKYKSATLNAPVTEYLMVLRLGEQYLIRAEARARQGNVTGVTGALADLDMIRKRAGLANYSGVTDQASVLAAILHERQVELFTEWGHRWLDLKRTNNVDAVMTVVAPEKGTTWNPDWGYYPLALYDITQDPNLVQNAGY